MAFLRLLIILFIACLPVQATAQFGIGGSMDWWVSPSASHQNPSITLPSANLQALYSVIQYQGWAGNCLQVERSSDNATMNIGFVNGVCDINTAMNFIGAGNTGYVITWYDQSGNGNDATQSTTANSLTFTNFNMINNIPGLTDWTSGNNYLTLPVALASNTQSETVFSVQATIGNSGAVWSTSSNYATGVSLNFSQLGGDNLLSVGPGFQNTTVYGNTTYPDVKVVTLNSTSNTYQVNGQLKTGLTTANANTSTGGFIGTLSAGGYTYYGQVYLVAIYNNVMAQGTIATNEANLETVFGINTTPDARIIWDGDSITLGTGSTAGVNNPFQTKPLLNSQVYMHDIGIFGQSLTTCIANETANIVNAYNASFNKNIVVIEAGEEDICINSVPASTVETNIQTYITAAKNAGYIVFPVTFIYDGACTSGSANDIQRQNYNTWIKSNASSLGVTVIDYDSIPQLQYPQTAGYSADGTHPTTLGYGLEAQIAAAALNSILP